MKNKEQDYFFSLNTPVFSPHALLPPKTANFAPPSSKQNVAAIHLIQMLQTI